MSLEHQRSGDEKRKSREADTNKNKASLASGF